ncbi:anti-sigma factor domain-containing protein [Peptacetobacter hiranonis]|uniref:anti-sigma factor domain-containing protein n=1 Tax=Peptacetobacter hiranonis TaxID=89152 RepID=UPI002E790FC4|nr:anti-sigma factor domain-containing protein [Peptacetobacter hiranonis]MEE0248468.1 anti-sigma factor domain-containing protein [Peptacetobacter hiranonis]
MLYKGIIIEVKDEYSIVVTNESEFLRIKNKEGMKVGDKIYFLEEDIYNTEENTILSDQSKENEEKSNIIDFKEKKEKSKNNMNRIYKRLVSVAATIAIIVGAVIYTSSPKSYATVSFDENGSSLELNLDKNKKVNSTSLINGSLDISDDDDFSMVLDQLYKQIKRDSKNNKNGRVLVGLCFEDTEDLAYEKEIKNLISQKFKGLNIMYVRVDKNQVNMNQNAEISMGEYAAMKMIEEDDIEGMTMDRLNQMLKDGKYKYLREEILDELEDKSEGYEDDDDDDIDEIEDYYKNSNRKNNNTNSNSSNKKYESDDDNDDEEDDDHDDDDDEED